MAEGAHVTMGVRELACRLNNAADNLARTAQIEMGADPLRLLVEAEGRHVIEAQRTGAVPPAFQAGDCTVPDHPGQTRMSVGVDGVMVPPVTDAEKRKRREKTLEQRRARAATGRTLDPLPGIRMHSPLHTVDRRLFASGLLIAWVSSLTFAAEKPLPPNHAIKLERGLKLFDERIGELLTTRCLECHSGDKLEGALDLSTRDSLHKGGERGPAVLTGRGADSLLTKLVRRQQEPHMPAAGDPISAADCKVLAEWIDCGAPYSHPLGGGNTVPDDWTQRRIPPEAAQHWAFLPLQKSAPPLPAPHSENPIDAFLRAAQVEHGVSSLKRADRWTQIRRLTLDLLGLPPTPDEVDAFVVDESVDSYERLVDRLLADPRHGERYARHWLDLARFAESHGFEHDYDRTTAFHYRDFVVQAFNDNLPFDEFVRWQIAGDELAPDNRLAQMATGFLAAGVHSTQITANEVERHRYDELDDMLNTIGTSMLGLSIGCARCHDHKFDPIPQADYYRLLSAFTTTVRSEVELDFDPQGYAAALAVFERGHAPYVAAVANYERDMLPQRLQDWLATDATKSLSPTWLAPSSIEVRSESGAKFTLQPDGSWLATGTNGDKDTYIIKLRTQLPNVAAIRLEALSDVSLKNGGPGRADNGNFALSRIEIAGCRVSSAKNQVPDKSTTDSTINHRPSTIESPLSIAAARATFEQLGLPIAAALDDSPASAWAVDPQFGRHHAAVFDLAEPWQTPAGQDSEITIRLIFQCNTQHSMGRIRVSLATSPNVAADNADSFAEEILTILKTPRESWTGEQQARMLLWYRSRDAGWKEIDDRRATHAATAPKPRVQKVLVATEGLPAIKLHTQAAQEFLNETHFLRRGDPEQKDRVADLGVLQAMSGSRGDIAPWLQTPPPEWRTSYRRRALAAWITEVDQGAGALLARVAVNRLWQHHFGRGLVATPSDFGRRGELPSHPALLDWLAAELVRTKWDQKAVHRWIVTSHVFRQSLASDPAQIAVDPDNRWLGRWQPRRLEAEAIRDSLLSVTGLLDDRQFGPGTLDANQTRRSLYFTVKRSQLVPMLSVFDAPDGTTGVGQRGETTIAPQALWQLNDQQVRRAARELSNRIAAQTSDPSDRVQQLYRILLQRAPSELEQRASVRFLTQSPGESGLLDLCHTLLCLHELVMVP